MDSRYYSFFMLVAYRVAKFCYSKQTSSTYGDIDTVSPKASTFPFDWLTGQTQMPALNCGLPFLTLALAQAVFQYVLESVRQQQASGSHSFPVEPTLVRHLPLDVMFHTRPWGSVRKRTEDNEAGLEKFSRKAQELESPGKNDLDME